MEITICSAAQKPLGTVTVAMDKDLISAKAHQSSSITCSLALRNYHPKTLASILLTDKEYWKFVDSFFVEFVQTGWDEV